MFCPKTPRLHAWPLTRPRFAAAYEIVLLLLTACAKPLGMENRQLEQISGSSNKNRWHYIRLNNLPWYPTTSDKRIFIQVVIRPYGKTVTALSIQGHSYWVISFTLGTSEDGSEWYDYNINGNIVVSVLKGQRVILEIHWQAARV